jgi:hypothetical protein
VTKKERMYQRIEQHGKGLIAYFGIDENPVKLCKKLRRLELAANRLMVDYCNGDCTETELDAYVQGPLKASLIHIFGEQGYRSIYINHDPRGYTLKINSLESKRLEHLYRDWGGYVILAPDFSQE